jgi:putative membrane protein
VEGFLPMSRASFVLDFIAVAMAAVLPILLVSLYQVRQRRNYQLHKRIQILLGLVLGVAILVFELDMRLYGWRQFAEPSPYYTTFVIPSLIFHLIFAIPTLFLWIYTIVMALRQRIDTQSGNPQFRHKFFGRLSAYAMIGTTLSGWLFFWLAFMA